MDAYRHWRVGCAGLAAIVFVAGGWGGAARADALRKIVVSGVLDVLQEDDFEHGRTRRVYRLLDDDGEHVFLLKFKKPPKEDLVTGTRVRVRGDEAGAAIAVDADADALVVLAEAAPVMVLRRAVVLLVDFAGDPIGTGAGSVSCSATQIADLMYTRVQSSGGNFEDNYNATSYNQLGWEPNADGLGGADVFRVSITAAVSETCSSMYSTWANEADAAATALGVNLSLYQHRVYVVPNATNCGWAGLANVGCGSSCRAWIKGSSCGTLDIYTHEVGHNIGMGHSSTDTDNNGAIDATCSYWGTSYSGGEYCDRSDFMGIGGDGKRQNNAPHKQQMGWVPAGQSIDASGGTYTLAPLGTDPALVLYPQVLRVPRGSGTPYYVSYRTTGDAYEDNLRSEYVQKTFIHTHAGGSSNTLLVGYVGDGQTFSDTVNGLSVSQVAHTTGTATIQVATTCAPLTPTVTLSPSTAAGRPGDTVSYSVVVTNRDSAACAASTFSLAAAVPLEWTAALASTTIPLAPGQQGSTTLTVTSATAALDGSYAVSVTATDVAPADPSGSGTGSATYCVDGIGPAAVTDLVAAVKQKSRVQLTWSVPSATGCATVTSYDVYRNGTRIATTATTSYLDGSLASGTYAYMVIGRDSLGNVSGASNTASVTIGGGTTTKEVCTNRVDDDGDGAVDCADADCARNRACR